MKIVIDGIYEKEARPDTALIKLVAKVHLLKVELEGSTVSSIKALATKYKADQGDAKNLAPLSYLAPSIVEDIFADINQKT